MQDTLLSTLQRRFLGDEEAVSVALSGTLCISLLSILRSSGKQTSENIEPCFGRVPVPIDQLFPGAMILASPWTQTLRDELGRVLAGTAQDNYSLGLCRQLKCPGAALIAMVHAYPPVLLEEPNLSDIL